MPVARNFVSSAAASVVQDVDTDAAAGDGDGDGDDGRTYCVCDRVSFGEMIACDDENCEKEWVSRLSLLDRPTRHDLESPVPPRVHRPYSRARRLLGVRSVYRATQRETFGTRWKAPGWRWPLGRTQRVDMTRINNSKSTTVHLHVCKRSCTLFHLGTVSLHTEVEPQTPCTKLSCINRCIIA